MRTTGISRAHVVAAAVAVSAVFAGAAFGATTSTPRRDIRPLSFESNEGQVAGPVRFSARGGNYTLWLSPGETTMSFRKGGQVSALRVKLVGANAAAEIVGLDRQKGVSNYYVGAPAQWREKVPHFGRVAYRDVYPGVNLVHYGNEGVLEYDFVVAPGADPSAIRLQVEGASKIQIQKNGDLLLKTATGEVVHRAPVVYQEQDGVRSPVSGRFVIEASNQVRFELGDYDRQMALVIDPVLSFSTYLGGRGTNTQANAANDQAFAARATTQYGNTTDTDGFVYVAGQTNAAAFPTAGLPAQPARSAGVDAFVTAFAADGQSLLFSTYLGGGATDSATGIAIDGTGNAYVTGATNSNNFPTAGVPFQSSRVGSNNDAFVAKLDTFGSLVYSTLLGGSANDEARAIAVDGTGNAYVTGVTASADFDVTQGPGKSGNTDAFVTKLDVNGSNLVYSTRLGGAATEEGNGIGVDSVGRASIAGITTSGNFPTSPNAFQAVKKTSGDAFVTRLDADGSINYSTFLGGNQNDVALSLDLGSGGNPYVTGQTASTNFPTKKAFQKTNGGGQDVFVAHLLPDAATAADTLAFSTYVGGPGTDRGESIQAGNSGHSYVVGTTTGDFPTTDAFQPDPGGGTSDAFALRLDVGGNTLRYSTYLGGDNTDSGHAAALVKFTGNLFVVGTTASRNYPVEPGSFQTVHGGTNNNNEAFVSRLPTVDLTGPANGNVFAIGTSRLLQWFASLPSSESLNVEASDDGGSSWVLIANVSAASTNLNWTVSGVAPTTDGRVRVSWAADGRVFGESTVTFANPAITSLQFVPGAATVEANESGRIVSWKHNLGSQAYFRLELDRNLDGVDEVVGACLGPADDIDTGNAGDFRFVWDPSLPTAATAHFIVTWYSDGASCATPDAGVTATGATFAIVP